MIGIVISVFDQYIGPKIILKIPHKYHKIPIKKIPSLMDLFDEGFIVHEFDDLKTANLIFNIYNPLARGGHDLLMLSIISYRENNKLNISSFRDIIEYFRAEIIKIPDLYKGFHHEEISKGKKIYNKIEDLTNTFYNLLPKGNAKQNNNFKKRLIYELSTLGKKEIISHLQKKSFKSTKSTKKIKAELLEKLRQKDIHQISITM